MRAADAAGEPLLVLGGGSNLVVADEGFDGTVLQVATRGVAVAPLGEHALAGRGRRRLGPRGRRCRRRGLRRPRGSVGHPRPGRRGARSRTSAPTARRLPRPLAWVRVLDRTTHDVVQLTPDECGFAYRDSVFKRVGPLRRAGRRVRRSSTPRSARRSATPPSRRTSASRSAPPCPAADVRAAVLDLRRAKGMVLDPGDHDTWSAGLVLHQPGPGPGRDDGAPACPADAPRWPESDGRVKISAAWLIEQAGFARGYGAGPARVSTKHTLALTNRGGATTEDLLALAREIRDGVRDRFGVTLVNEPVLVGVTL